MGSELILMGGGVRAGKSSYAVELIKDFEGPYGMVATAQALDEEMSDRIRRHRLDRDPNIKTIEEPFEVIDALKQNKEIKSYVLDCVTLWVSNLILRGEEEAKILAMVEELVKTREEMGVNIIAVSNEVGMGVVPTSALGRTFRDTIGRVHQILSRHADRVYFSAMGTFLQIKPMPVKLVERGK